GAAPRQRRGHDVRRRHHAVGVLVVLVHADGIEAELVGVLEHVEVLVIELVAANGIVEMVRYVDPDAVVAFAEVGRQPAVGHEVEEAELQVTSSRSGGGTLRAGWYQRSHSAYGKARGDDGVTEARYAARGQTAVAHFTLTRRPGATYVRSRLGAGQPRAERSV